MESYKVQVDVDPETGITVHFKPPETMVQVTPVANETELTQRMIEITDQITCALPKTLRINRSVRRAQIDELTDELREAFRTGNASAASGLYLSNISPVPEVRNLFRDPQIGREALCALILELMGNGGQFAEEEGTPPCIDEG